MQQERKNYSLYRDHSNSLTESAGFFGTEFFPPWLLEAVSDNSTLDPDDLKEHDIYLHAEAVDNEAKKVHSLRFRFPEIEQWETGKHQLPGISKQKLMEHFRLMWEVRQNHHHSKNKTQDQITGIFSAIPTEKMAAISYSETGFITENSYGIRIDSTGFSTNQQKER